MESFPANLDVLADVDVEYVTLPGWQQPTTGAKSFRELPENAQKYVEFIERFIKVPIKYIVSLFPSLLPSSKSLKHIAGNWSRT